MYIRFALYKNIIIVIIFIIYFTTNTLFQPQTPCPNHRRFVLTIRALPQPAALSQPQALCFQPQMLCPNYRRFVPTTGIFSQPVALCPNHRHFVLTRGTLPQPQAFCPIQRHFAPTTGPSQSHVTGKQQQTQQQTPSTLEKNRLKQGG